MRFNISHIPESKLEQTINEWKIHNDWANLEREYYSIDITNHISWDFAESIQLPYSSQQEGAIYFKSLYKVAVFGICEDAFPCTLPQSTHKSVSDIL
ncbi:13722_t:CDS:2 [Cetraspora pellucida]|uniref:13722_t:CDS:1 n=1 Tax=Cetraspora pellucida TaxID=1433469 RepID=A0A9N8VU79_9GLOM|nr:13722_t:CDS:2 [Cetraspora pellucida]